MKNLHNYSLKGNSLKMEVGTGFDPQKKSVGRQLCN